MAIYQITTANSVLTTANEEPAFKSDSPGADTLIVDAGAYLKVTGQYSIAAYLDDTMAWTVAVSGLIHSDTDVGLYVDLNSAHPSSVAVAAGGKIHGGIAACYNPTNLTNAGFIYGLETGVYATAALAQIIRNSGTIYGGTHSFAGSSYADSVTNTGFFEGDLQFDDGGDLLINANVIFDNVDMGEGNDAVTNTRDGTVGGDLALGGGHDRLTNLGWVHGTVYGGEGNDAIVNKGALAKDVFLGNGANSLTNAASIGGYVFGGTGTDIVRNSGVILGVIDLGSGDDSFTGGNYGETLVDGAASDTVKFGGGDDFYFGIGNFNQADDGTDVIDGGAGFDSYNAASALDAVYINLDSKAHDFSPFLPGVGLVAGNTATGVGLSTDTIRNFEAVIGGAGNDIVYGNASANLLIGSDGFDTLYGFGGNDVLIGGDGGDALCGGLGRDMLTGGAGADFFQYAAIADSGIGVARRDVIADFESGIDKIDLLAIDANTRNGSAVNDAFTFVNAFTGVAGQLRAYGFAGGQIVEGDVNGDGNADFSIEVVANPFTLTLTAADFLL